MTQMLELVARRWDDLLQGRKLDTIRLNEGRIEPGFMVYEVVPERDQHCVVYVTDTMDIPLREVLLHTLDTERKPNETELLNKMREHYPDIELDTVVHYVKHLSVEQTLEKYPREVAEILKPFTDRNPPWNLQR